MDITNTLSARSLQYYVMARHWESDLEFFRIETDFLSHLINYNLKLVKAIFDTSTLRSLLGKINRLKQDEQAVAKLLAAQLQQLELMAEDIIPENVDEVKGKQVHLECLVAGLLKEYQAVKKSLFATIEHTLKENRTTVA
ncbi:hypothetical protein DYU05_06855 [Mucilaginibacter terrenus]|uniref:Uncharacterized protein n=1 Tax=Mucilaginibacter terrenus TaxID=2482727 RepID=A0A3E2NWG9_9SPHI|nr:hypothetical protein [Mucilaginibacter terrenus]RFZ85309.1 hypothetical protein DYU05_06855 [Mucilaginibacter terrenus]